MELNPPTTDNTESLVCKAEKQYDSFYLTECSWPTLMIEDKTEAYFYSQDEIMSVLRDCHARHNSLIKEMESPTQ